MRIITSFLVVLIAISFGLNFAHLASAQEGEIVKGEKQDDFAAPEASTTLVLSQVYGGGGGATGTYSADYVEIKNISASPQSLNTLSIMYGSSTGQFGSSAGNIQALPNTTLNPGQYFLIQLGTVGGAGAPVPSPDLTNTTTNLSGASGKVALVTAAFVGNTCGATATPCTLPNAGIIDVVSFGVSNNAEGGAPTNGGAALTPTQGNVRKANGCTDTDNNNADNDIVTAPVPHNTASTVAPCSGGGGGGTPPKLFKTNLSGANEVPANASTATGFGRLYLNAAETQITASFYFQNLSANSTAGHIHGAAAVGTNGPILFDMLPPTGVTSGQSVDKVFPVTAAQVADLKAGLWYFNVHSTAFTGGEIRGQIRVNKPRFDMDGDGDADYGIIRQGAGGGSGQATWYTNLNSGTPTDPAVITQWGLNSDTATPSDFDGDGKTDIAFWRPSGSPSFFILRSSTGTLQQIPFGVPGDDPTIVGDYDGDGKANAAIYRPGLPAPGNQQSYFWDIPTSGPLVGVQRVRAWGLGSDIATPGDFDGDGQFDLCVTRSIGGLNYFILLTASNVVTYTAFGVSGANPDLSATGDYDGDGKNDYAITRFEGASIVWWYRPSSGGADVRTVWGSLITTDVEAQGDYDGDGKTDIAVWRPTGGSSFYAIASTGGVRYKLWGIDTDVPSIYDMH